MNGSKVQPSFGCKDYCKRAVPHYFKVIYILSLKISEIHWQNRKAQVTVMLSLKPFGIKVWEGYILKTGRRGQKRRREGRGDN